MQTKETIENRRSVREFQDVPIPKKDLVDLIDAGRLAATARNEQPWEFVVVSDKEALVKLGGIASPNGSLIAGASACVAVFCKDTKYYLEDGCAATENILLRAYDLGIGSCWIAGDKKPYDQAVKDLLGVPKGYKLISLIALGYAKAKAAVAKRKVEEVIHWQKF